MSNSHLIIIIPVFNEATVIRKVIGELINEGFSEIVIVDDGSSDNLQQVISDLPATYIKHRINLGQGAALQTGIEYCKATSAEIVVTFDADGQHCAESIHDLIQPILQGHADVTLGSRFLSETANELPVSRLILIQVARFVNFLLFGYLFSDAHNGLRAFNRKAIDLINITENRMAHASEFPAQIKQNKLRVTEVPVKVKYDQYSKKKGQSGFDSVRVFFDLVLHKFFK